MKKEFLLIKRMNDIITEITAYPNADALLNDAKALDAAAPKGASYQTVYGYNVRKDYSIGDPGDDFDLLDLMEVFVTPI